MIKIFLTIDPDTGRGLYDDESQLMGQFGSLVEAENTLGDLLRYCSIRHESEHGVGIDY